ncbi:DNA alkylation repair protein [Arthrobacter sp. ISL-30]|uniref:DNA alkylation repair protein n=1 Tax=Arthrobacter sp. ISL-30 TaxID=2819109 RepID=UPI001BEC9F1A|nr:DNA alkylation repair protein [Arthrobacter sp. ISL-30]MBT2512524.1 DNA alkylation repair protein [Arthrobacter sp. ISL-30]
MGAMNELIDKAAVVRLRDALAAASPGSSWTRLEASIEGLDSLNLRGRTDLVSDALLEDLLAAQAAEYPTAARIFRAALGQEAFTGWMLWPVSEAAVTLALKAGNIKASNMDDFDDCLRLLSELTPRLTGEFAIRRLLSVDPDRALARILEWTTHPNEHVRRLASEGTRPYLPWAVRVPKLLKQPEATLPILHALYRDSHEYVRRCVANHLNDIARHAPDLVVATAAAWLAEPDANTPWVVRQGLRTLIKKAHPGALAVLGFAPAAVAVSAPRLDRDVVMMPSDLAFEFEISNSSAAPARLAVDYVIHYVKASGLHAEKVFKLAALTLEPGETRLLAKRHAFRPMTTRVHYPGVHALELQVNGERHAWTEFTVEA